MEGSSGTKMGFCGLFLERSLDQINDVRFLFSYASVMATKTRIQRSLQLPMKFSNIAQVETSRYLTKITTLRRKADRKSARSKVLAAKHMASLQCDLASPRTVAKYFFARGGGEAGRAIDCSIASCRDELMKRGRGLQARGAYSRCQA